MLSENEKDEILKDEVICPIIIESSLSDTSGSLSNDSNIYQKESGEEQLNMETLMYMNAIKQQMMLTNQLLSFNTIHEDDKEYDESSGNESDYMKGSMTKIQIRNMKSIRRSSNLTTNMVRQHSQLR